jgi:hypothetical protein
MAHVPPPPPLSLVVHRPHHHHRQQYCDKLYADTIAPGRGSKHGEGDSEGEGEGEGEGRKPTTAPPTDVSADLQAELSALRSADGPGRRFWVVDTVREGGGLHASDEGVWCCCVSLAVCLSLLVCVVRARALRLPKSRVVGL